MVGGVLSPLHDQGGGGEMLRAEEQDRVGAPGCAHGRSVSVLAGAPVADDDW